MELNLHREDLKPEHKDISCSKTRFEHFNEEAQQAILAAGRGVFRDDDRWRSYNAILKPESAGQG